MSDLRVALVAEGPTDAIIIEAALKALLPGPFVLTQLQPEQTRPALGTGWGGVLRWCLEFESRGLSKIEDDPTLPGFDLFVIHVDADITECRYSEVSDEIAQIATQRDWPVLPNSFPCPPSAGSSDAVRACVLSWAGLQNSGPKTVLCVPSKSTDTWLAAAVLRNGHALLSGLECNLNLGAKLGALPKAERLRKTSREYRAREKKITDAWAIVRTRCSQADRFSNEVAAVVA